MRIIAGSAKGRRLVSPPGGDTRPLTGRAKEALFSSLGGRVVDADVVDLYAGTGSIGLEALSRGASRVVFVEKGRSALGALRKNIDAVGLGGDVVSEDVGAFLARVHDTFDLAFVDPPYALPLASLATVLEQLAPVSRMPRRWWFIAGTAERRRLFQQVWCRRIAVGTGTPNCGGLRRRTRDRGTSAREF